MLLGEVLRSEMVEVEISNSRFWDFGFHVFWARLSRLFLKSGVMKSATSRILAESFCCHVSGVSGRSVRRLLDDLNVFCRVKKIEIFFEVASAMTEKRNKKSRMADLRSEKSKIGKFKFVFFPLTKRVGGGCVRGG